MVKNKLIKLLCVWTLISSLILPAGFARAEEDFTARQMLSAPLAISAASFQQACLQLGREVEDLDTAEKRPVLHAYSVRTVQGNPLAPELRSMLEAALRICLAKGYRITTGQIIEEMISVDQKQAKRLSPRLIHGYIKRSRERLRIPVGKNNKASFLTILDCLEAAILKNYISYTNLQAARFHSLLKQTREKQYPFTEREKEVFILLAAETGSYEKVGGKLKLTNSRVGKLYAAGLAKLGITTGPETKMSSAIQQALEKNKLGPLSLEDREKLLFGISALEKEEQNPLTPAVRGILQAALRIGLEKKSPEITYPEISEKIKNRSGKKKSYKAIQLLVGDASRQLGIKIENPGNFQSITQCTLKAAEQGYIICTESELSDFRAHCLIKKLNPLQKSIVLLQGLGLTPIQTYETIIKDPELSLVLAQRKLSPAKKRKSVSTIYNHEIRGKFGVPAGKNAMAITAGKALEEGEITVQDFISAAQRFNIRLYYIALNDLDNAEKVRGLIESLCEKFACAKEDIFTSPKIKYAKSIVLQGPEAPEIMNTAELLDVYKKCIFRKCPSLRYRLMKLERQNPQHNGNQLPEEDYTSVFMEFFYEREKLKNEVEDDLLNWYFYFRQVLPGITLSTNSRIVQKWGIRIYEDIFGMEFRLLIKELFLTKPEKVSFYGKKYAKTETSAEEASITRTGRPAIVYDSPYSGTNSKSPRLKTLFAEYFQGQIKDSELEDKLKRLCFLCESFSADDIAAIERRIETARWAQDELSKRNEDWKNLKAKIKQRTLSMATYFRFGLLCQRISGGKALAVLNRQLAEAKLIQAEDYAERQMAWLKRQEEAAFAEDGDFGLILNEEDLKSIRTKTQKLPLKIIEQSI